MSRQVVAKRRYGITTIRCEISEKSADPIYCRTVSPQSHTFICNTLYSTVHKTVKNSAQHLLIYGPIFI